MKRFMCIVLAFFLLYSTCIPAEAAVTEKGSIEIKVAYEERKITGGDLIAVRVGYVDPQKKVFCKVTTHAVIEGIGEPTTVTQMQNFYTAYKNKYRFEIFETEIKDGVGRFENIPTGLYLIYQDNAASGFSKLPAFLITIPYNEKMNVSVASKTELKCEAEPESGTPGSGSSSSQKLPQTGQLTWPIPWMACTGMMLFVLGWWLCFGRKEESE